MMQGISIADNARGKVLAIMGVAYLWLNISEVFRYFAIVMPMMRVDMAMVPDVAPMNLTVFLIWGFWDTLLFGSVAMISWLHYEKFGGGPRNALYAGTLLWIAVFCIFWLAAYNINLATARMPLAALPLAWLEMVVTVAILHKAWALQKSG
jgi:hypothetical protein